jgi:hypothetical protein
VPEQPEAEGTAEIDDKAELRESFKEALARKQAKNSHVERHLDGHTVGHGQNDTTKRMFRRKSG